MLPARSNPVKVEAHPDTRIFWGDMHNHTLFVDGTDTVEWVYVFGRDYAFLDVCAASEHIWGESPNWLPHPVQALWEEQQKQTAAYYEPGKFVTFLGYEYSNGHELNADHCVWFKDDQHELIMHEEVQELAKLLTATEAFLAPHVGGAYVDWTYEMPASVMPNVEIASMHEHSEWFGQRGLQAGFKLGFVAMSDGHMGRPGYDMWARHGRTGVPKRAYSPQSGITAFRASRLDRDAIWEAFGERNTYATTGARILLEVECAGARMGEEVSVERAPTLAIKVFGTQPLDRVQIIRGDRSTQTYELSPVVTAGDEVWDFGVEWTDPEPIRGETYYYVRVTQSDNHFAWSSPLFVTCAEGISPDEDVLIDWNDDVWPPRQGVNYDFLPELEVHLEQRGIGGRYADLEQIGIFEEQRGRYVLFRARDTERDGALAHIHYYLGFEDQRLYLSAGGADYGQVPNAGLGA
jgi:hypothetical protein